MVLIESILYITDSRHEAVHIGVFRQDEKSRVRAWWCCGSCGFWWSRGLGSGLRRRGQVVLNGYPHVPRIESIWHGWGVGFEMGSNVVYGCDAAVLFMSETDDIMYTNLGGLPVIVRPAIERQLGNAPQRPRPTEDTWPRYSSLHLLRPQRSAARRQGINCAVSHSSEKREGQLRAKRSQKNGKGEAKSRLVSRQSVMKRVEVAPLAT